MSAHEGVSCDACGKSNFRFKRYKCLICYDYDLCSNCYEQSETSSQHTIEHPMQCKNLAVIVCLSELIFFLGILTRQDFDFYYQGERFSSDQPQSLTCPFCGEMGFALPFSTDSSSSNSSLSTSDLFHHLQMKHGDDQQSSEVICPICAAMSNGEPNLVTADLVAHIANDHQPTQVQTPSSAGGASNPYSRQSSSNRDFDFSSGSGTRASFRRGPLRAPSRRGGLGRGGGTVSQHFVVDTSAVSGANDPIADLLSQLSTVRRLAAANNNNSSSSPNTINLQTLTRQQYERERLRAVGRSHQNSQQSSQPPQPSATLTPPSSAAGGGGGGAAAVLPSAENDFFDSLFASALFVDPAASSWSTGATTGSQQTWAQVVAQQQSNPVPEQQQTSSKAPAAEPDPSLLRKICDEAYTPPSGPATNAVVQQQKRRTEFVHSLLLSTLMSPLNDHDK